MKLEIDLDRLGNLTLREYDGLYNVVNEVYFADHDLKIEAIRLFTSGIDETANIRDQLELACLYFDAHDGDMLDVVDIDLWENLVDWHNAKYS